MSCERHPCNRVIECYLELFDSLSNFRCAVYYLTDPTLEAMTTLATTVLVE